jgi:RHS repeat-associated protein
MLKEINRLPFGRRLSKSLTTSSGTTTTYFLYADEGLIAEADAQGTLTKTYGWIPKGIWGTAPVWMRVINSTTETNGYHWFINDDLGTPQKLAAPNGAVTWSAAYDVFGAATVDTSNSTVVNNLRFPGQYFDQETSLHYNWHRYYDPATGRYTTADPIKFLGGINFYQYARNSPVNYFDPRGLKTNWGCLLSCSANCVLQHLDFLLNQAIGQIPGAPSLPPTGEDLNEAYEFAKCLRDCAKKCKDDCNNDNNNPPGHYYPLVPYKGPFPLVPVKPHPQPFGPPSPSRRSLPSLITP